MIGVGTGIAPFRAFLKHIYEERREWKGKVRLFYGARTGMDLLYMNDRNNDLSLYYDQGTFRAIEALSPRPHADAPEDIQRSLQDNKDEVASLILDKKTFVYVSGLSRLENTLDSILTQILSSSTNWNLLKEDMIAQGRWSTLFYE
jgi:ferredoxin--NADP+ reductase